MIRVNAGGAIAGAETSQRCRDAIERWNPSLIRG
jgi:hypothetical protein